MDGDVAESQPLLMRNQDVRPIGSDPLERPERRGREMTHSARRSGREQGGQEFLIPRLRDTGEAVHARMDDDELARSDPVVDATLGYPGLNQLLSRDQTQLTERDRCDRSGQASRHASPTLRGEGTQ